MRHIGILIIIFIIILFAYITVLPEKIGEEPVLSPAWITDLRDDVEENLNSSNQRSDSSADVFGFQVHDFVGFIDEDGDLIHFNEVRYGAAIADERYINFSSISENNVVLDSEGKFLFTIDSKGYPLMEGERILLLSTDRAGIEEWDTFGNLLWHNRFSSIITDIDLASDFLAVGLMEGRILVLDSMGKLLSEIIPEESRVPIIYGCSIDETGNILAVVSGLGPQKLTLLQREPENDFEKVFVHDLSSEVREAAIVMISRDGSFLYCQEGNDMLIYSLDSKRMVVIEGIGRSFSITPDQGLGFASILTEVDDVKNLSCVFMNGENLLKWQVPAYDMFVRHGADYLIIGKDDLLFRINVQSG
jgi:hypothetical protein